MEIVQERWRVVAGVFSGYPYEVSDSGKVRRTVGGKGTRAGKILKPGVDRRGYEYVFLSDRELGQRRAKIHRLVATAFVGKPHGRVEVNHIDGNTRNNRWENLEWVSHQQNMAHAVELGLIKSGEDSPYSKLTRLQADFVRDLYSRGRHATNERIARWFGVSKGTVRRITAGASCK